MEFSVVDTVQKSGRRRISGFCVVNGREGRRIVLDLKKAIYGVEDRSGLEDVVLMACVALKGMKKFARNEPNAIRYEEQNI